MHYCNSLCLSRCSYRAVSCASTAIDASIFVDYIRCTLFDSLNRAAFHTNATSDAILRNLICHNITSFLRYNIYKRSIALRFYFVNTKKQNFENSESL